MMEMAESFVGSRQAQTVVDTLQEYIESEMAKRNKNEKYCRCTYTSAWRERNKILGHVWFAAASAHSTCNILETEAMKNEP